VSRTYFIRVNLDDMCAELDTLRPEQHADWLAGFRAGSRGKVPPEWDGPRLAGAEFGLICYREAEDFRSRQSEKGKLSAAARSKGNHGSTTVQPNVNQTSTQPINQQPTSNNQETNRVASAPTRFLKPSADEVKAFCSEHGYAIDADAFVDYYEANGWKIGKNPMKSWRAAIRTWVRRDAAKPAPVLVCPHPPDSYAAMDWWALHGDIK